MTRSNGLGTGSCIELRGRRSIYATISRSAVRTTKMYKLRGAGAVLVPNHALANSNLLCYLKGGIRVQAVYKRFLRSKVDSGGDLAK